MSETDRVFTGSIPALDKQFDTTYTVTFGGSPNYLASSATGQLR